MLYGKILYPPAFGSTLKSLDKSVAEAIPGVKVVRDTLSDSREGFGREVVGIVAPDPATAGRAIAALKAEWQPGPDQPTSKDVNAWFKKTAREGASSSSLTSYEIA